MPDHSLKAEEALQRIWEPEEGGHDAPPTPEKFRQAKGRELARLNVRLSSILGRYAHTPEDLKLVSGDTPELEVRDRETIRRWCKANPPLV